MLSDKCLSNKIKVCLVFMCFFMFNMSLDLYIFTSPIIFLFHFSLACVTLSMKNMKLSLIGLFVDDKNLCFITVQQRTLYLKIWNISST